MGRFTTNPGSATAYMYLAPSVNFYVRVREDMKMNEILFLLVFPMVLQTANAAIVQFDICPATNGVADWRKFYRSCILKRAATRNLCTQMLTTDHSTRYENAD